jgi:hypothetical protein
MIFTGPVPIKEPMLIDQCADCGADLHEGDRVAECQDWGDLYCLTHNRSGTCTVTLQAPEPDPDAGRDE